MDKLHVFYGTRDAVRELETGCIWCPALRNEKPQIGRDGLPRISTHRQTVWAAIANYHDAIRKLVDEGLTKKKQDYLATDEILIATESNYFITIYTDLAQAIQQLPKPSSRSGLTAILQLHIPDGKEPVLFKPMDSLTLPKENCDRLLAEMQLGITGYLRNIYCVFPSEESRLDDLRVHYPGVKLERILSKAR